MKVHCRKATNTTTTPPKGKLKPKSEKPKHQDQTPKKHYGHFDLTLPTFKRPETNRSTTP